MRPLLQTKDLKIGYTNRKQGETVIADGLSLALHRGELVCLLGPNGAGKSTLIRSLAGVDRHLSGSIELDGEDVSRMSPKQRARLTSVVLTDALPVGMLSVYGLVALGRFPHSRWTGRLSPHDHDRVSESLDTIGIAHLAKRQFQELSDGERQKALIARALAQEASVLMLDEPTAFVDLPRRVELMHELVELARRAGMAILLSSHDLDLALRCADQLWLMDSNGSVEKGYPEDLALSGRIATAFESDEVHWDSDEGCFRLCHPAKRRARLEGDGSVGLWTRRALSRKGYGLGEEGEISLEVVATREDGRPVWKARSSGPWRTFDSLEALFEWAES